MRAFCCFALLSFAPALLAQSVPEIEPNGTIATAQVVTLGIQIDAALVAGDVDWFSITLLAPTRVRIHTGSVPSTVAAHGDTRIQLWDAPGATLLAVDDDTRGSGNGWTGDITMNLAAGVYSCQVIGWDVTTAGPYSFEVSSLGPVRAYTAVEAEPNDTVATASPGLIAAGANLLHGSIAPETVVLSETVPAAAIVLSDIVAASTLTVITATAPLVASAYVPGFEVVMTSGVNVGLVRGITANTATTITTAAWPVANGVGDTYDVRTTSTTTLIRSTGALVAGAYTPAVAGFGRFYVLFTSGANVGLLRQISANTAGTITCTAFPAAPLAADTYDIVQVDVDYYSIVLTAPTNGIWFYYSEGDAPWCIGLRAEFYDAVGVPVASATLGTTSVQGTVGSTPRWNTTRVWPAGLYHVAVRRPTTVLATDSPNPLSVTRPYGNYCLELHVMPMDTGPVVAETEAVGGPNTNGTVATAVALPAGGIGTGNITNAAGGDPNDIWGPFVLTSPGTLTVQSKQGVAPALMDSTVRLLDAAGGVVATSTSGNILSPTSHGRIILLTFATPATYYVEVLSPGALATQTGNYEVQVSAIIPAQYVLGSFALFAANATCGPAPESPPRIVNLWTSTVPAVTGTAETPLIGATFQYKVVDMAPTAIYVMMTGLSLLPAPVPLSLIGFGDADCLVYVTGDLLEVGLADATGTANREISVPSTMALRGFVLWLQAAELTAFAPLTFEVGNYARILVGDRSY